MRRASQKDPYPRTLHCAALGVILILILILIPSLGGGCGWGARLRGERGVEAAVDFQEALWACGRIELPRPSREGMVGLLVACGFVAAIAALPSLITLVL